MTPSWLRIAGDDAVLTLHIQPGAKRTEVAGVHGEALKIRLNAPPVEGKANEALIAYLARQLDIPRARVLLEAGQTSRAKRVRLVGVDAGAVVERLAG
ncbi:MAG TPA: DUF167 family protein [Rhodocyclaceae bacterium]|nr:DUF167 family protein [Rhodocyclaceae bacterium]